MCKKDKRNGVPDSGVINSQFDAVTRYPQYPFYALSATLMPFHDNPTEISSAMLSVDMAPGRSALNGPAAKILERVSVEKTDKQGNGYFTPTEKAADFIARVGHEVKITLAQQQAQDYQIISLTNAIAGNTGWATEVHMVPDYVQCYAQGAGGLVVNNLLICRDEASIKAFFDGLHAHTSPDDWTEIPLKNGETMRIQNTAIAGMSALEDGSLAIHLSTTGMGRHQHSGAALKLDINGNADAYLNTWLDKATRPKATVTPSVEKIPRALELA